MIVMRFDVQLGLHRHQRTYTDVAGRSRLTTNAKHRRRLCQSRFWRWVTHVTFGIYQRIE